MRTAIAVAALSIGLLHCQAFPQSADGTHKALYEEHRWFALRDAISLSDGSSFDRAAVEDAFERKTSAERDLSKIIVEEPHSEDAYEAQELLSTLDFRHGEYKQGLLHLQAMLKEKPDAEDVKNAIAIYTAMGQVDQSTVALTSSTVRMLREDGTYTFQ